MVGVGAAASDGGVQAQAVEVDRPALGVVAEVIHALVVGRDADAVAELNGVNCAWKLLVSGAAAAAVSGSAAAAPRLAPTKALAASVRWQGRWGEPDKRRPPERRALQYMTGFSTRDVTMQRRGSTLRLPGETGASAGRTEREPGAAVARAGLEGRVVLPPPGYQLFEP
ncbi:MAG: hypothetical protein KGL43_10075 [Burkholderiales bacterium]|nr:hypothetical protein [Burkholderiales bacterium]MDE2453931.1 hypothetical protein [Burkholderiales bacterium]